MTEPPLKTKKSVTEVICEPFKDIQLQIMDKIVWGLHPQTPLPGLCPGSHSGTSVPRPTVSTPSKNFSNRALVQSRQCTPMTPVYFYKRLEYICRIVADGRRGQFDISIYRFTDRLVLTETAGDQYTFREHKAPVIIRTRCLLAIRSIVTPAFSKDYCILCMIARVNNFSIMPYK